VPGQDVPPHAVFTEEHSWATPSNPGLHRLSESIGLDALVGPLALIGLICRDSLEAASPLEKHERSEALLVEGSLDEGMVITGIAGG
jgi:hypothetical protein